MARALRGGMRSLLIAVLCAAGCRGESEEAPLLQMASRPGAGSGPPRSRLSACHKHVQVIGRHQRQREGGSCSGVAFDFSGVEVRARFANTSWATVEMSQAYSDPEYYIANFFNVYVDSQLHSSFDTSSWNRTGGSWRVKLFSGLDPSVTHEVAIFKNTEPQFNSKYVVPNYVTVHAFTGSSGMTLAQPSKPPRWKVEFLGDSITAGYCNSAQPCSTSSDCTPANQHFNESWPALICSALGAECHVEAWSGYGMAENCCGGKTLMSSVWLRTLGSLQALDLMLPHQTPPENLWDFRRWVPDAVVINLGTNDAVSWPHVIPAYNMTYLALLTVAARAYGPSTHFFLACGPMTSKYCPQVDWVMEKARAQVPGLKISFLNQRYYLNGSYGPACGYHPSVRVDLAMAKGAVPVIRRALRRKS
uniref:SGNH hydrolase-type esterase domain-containing protein n=1 Tax=Alexandrium monilatum TaxID=311494 RepID=A0A7S4UA24_9DINO